MGTRSWFERVCVCVCVCVEEGVSAGKTGFEVSLGGVI